jgi:hypothetical protein
MPIHRVSGGYKWGGKGHTYASRKGAEKQAAAAYANGYTGKSMADKINIFLSKRSHYPYFDPETMGYSKHPIWNDKGERVVSDHKMAKRLQDLSEQNGYIVDRLKLPDGSYKLTRTMAPVSNENDADISSSDLMSPSSYLNPNRLTGGSSTGFKAPKMIDPEQSNYRSIRQPIHMSIDKFLNKQYDKFAVATAQAEKMGYHDFREGTPGRRKRDEIAEALEREGRAVKKNVGENQISQGLEQYIIDWIKKHPRLDDKEFTEFIRSFGLRPEQGREALYRIIHDLNKSMDDMIVYPKKINKLEKLQVARVHNPDRGGYFSSDTKFYHAGPQAGGRYFEFPKSHYTRNWETPPGFETNTRGINLKDFHKHGGKIYLRNFSRETENAGTGKPETDWAEVDPRILSRTFRHKDLKGEHMPEFYLLPTNIRTQSMMRRTAPDPTYSDIDKSLSNKINKFIAKKKVEISMPTNNGVYGVQGHDSGVVV